MKKALFFASVASMIDQFNLDNIVVMQKLGYKVDVACNFEFGSTTSQERVNELKRELEKMGVNTYHIPVPRKPFLIKEMVVTYKLTKNLVEKNRYDIVHCHSPIGGAIARIACKNSRKKGTRVIYTAHGFHFFKGSSIKNWLIYYPVEKLLARYTDILITINKEDYTRAKQKFKVGSIEYIPGVGIDTTYYKNIKIDSFLKRRELGIPEDAFVLLSVGELNKNKNHEIIIRALSKLKINNIHYVICGRGPLDAYLKQLANSFRFKDRLHLLGYRDDIGEICKVSDVFCFPSKREGLGLAALEAMASGLPLITSNVHGIVDYSVDGRSGFSCRPDDIDEFAKAIKLLIENKELRYQMGQNNIMDVKKYDIKNVDKIMHRIYSQI